jgi:hypothetical protein
MWLALLLCVTMVALANAAYFLAASRVQGQGFPVKKFLMPRDIRQVFSVYGEIAGRCGWSRWPTVMFWPLVVSGLASGLLFADMLHKMTKETDPSSVVLPGRSIETAILVWLALLSLLQAIWFTRSILTEVSKLKHIKNERFRALLQVRQLREDMILAVLGWAGVLVITPFLVRTLVE